MRPLGLSLANELRVLVDTWRKKSLEGGGPRAEVLTFLEEIRGASGFLWRWLGLTVQACFSAG